MKFALFLAASTATTAAVRQSVLTLSADDKVVLLAELAEWEKEFGAKAMEMGVLPNRHNTESTLSEEEVLHDKLQRLLDTKFETEQAQLNNPEAQFDWRNPFALMTEEEFKMYISGSFEQGGNPLASLEIVELADTTSNRTTRADWTSRCNPPVRQQGTCGSCWAHAAVAAAEAAHCIATGELLSLSVQQVTSCSTEGGSQGCNGGFPWYALDYAADGLCLDSEWPYVGETGTCRECNKKQLSIGKSVRVSGESALANVLNTQPASVTVESGNSVWKNYRGGVVSQCPGAQSDHAVVAVGVDGETFKIKNSWGTSWGEGGYMRLKRGTGGEGTCNVAGGVAYPKITSKPNPPNPSPSPTSDPTDPTWEPQLRCGGCQACLYPKGGNSCLNDLSKQDCDNYSSNYGTQWCGN